MDNIIVYVDDASYALQMLEPMQMDGVARNPARWAERERWNGERARQAQGPKRGDGGWERTGSLLPCGECAPSQVQTRIAIHRRPGASAGAL